MSGSKARYIWTAVLVLTVALVSFPRFDRQDLGPIKRFTGKINGEQSLGDAVYYTAYVKYFRGEGSIRAVPLPFVYRPLIPFIASRLPIESSMTALNVLNLTALYVTTLFLFHLLKALGFGFRYGLIGCFIYAVSFPVFYMSTTGYLDACAMCMLVIGAFFIFRGKWLLLAVTIAVGVLVKEVIALLIPVAIAYLITIGSSRTRLLVRSLLLILAFVVPMAILKVLFKGTGDFYWIPNLPTLLDNLRVRALLSLLLSFGLPGLLSILFAVRYRRMVGCVERRFLLPLVTGILFTSLLVVYSMLTAYTDGRFIWPMTIFNIPLSLWVLRSWFLRQRVS